MAALWFFHQRYDQPLARKKAFGMYFIAASTG